MFYEAWLQKIPASLSSCVYHPVFAENLCSVVKCSGSPSHLTVFRTHSTPYNGKSFIESSHSSHLGFSFFLFNSSSVSLTLWWDSIGEKWAVARGDPSISSTLDQFLSESAGWLWTRVLHHPVYPNPSLSLFVPHGLMPGIGKIIATDKVLFPLINSLHIDISIKIVFYSFCLLAPEVLLPKETLCMVILDCISLMHLLPFPKNILFGSDTCRKVAQWVNHLREVTGWKIFMRSHLWQTCFYCI